MGAFGVCFFAETMDMWTCDHIECCKIRRQNFQMQGHRRITLLIEFPVAWSRSGTSRFGRTTDPADALSIPTFLDQGVMSVPVHPEVQVTRYSFFQARNDMVVSPRGRALAEAPTCTEQGVRFRCKTQDAVRKSLHESVTRPSNRTPEMRIAGW